MCKGMKDRVGLIGRERVGQSRVPCSGEQIVASIESVRTTVDVSKERRKTREASSRETVRRLQTLF